MLSTVLSTLYELTQFLYSDPIIIPTGGSDGEEFANLPAMWESRVQSLGEEDPLEKRMATHSSILAGEFHGQSSLTGYSPWGHKESDMTERFHFRKLRERKIPYDIIYMWNFKTWYK